jgi:hypothetical protein
VQASRRQALLARAQLAAGGLSHQQRRRLRRIVRRREDAARRRRRRLKRLAIVGTGTVAAVVVAAFSVGLISAIHAALSEGMTGQFVVTHQVCSTKTGCQWVGTFQAGRGTSVGGLAYGGALPAGDGPGSVIPARYPGGSDQVYALRGSHTWLWNSVTVLLIGGAVGAALWISPLGTATSRRAS